VAPGKTIALSPDPAPACGVLVDARAFLVALAMCLEMFHSVMCLAATWCYALSTVLV